MKFKPALSIVSVLMMLVASTLACSLFGRTAEATVAAPTEAVATVEVATDTPSPVPSDTPRPTWTPKPTKTPDQAATQAYEDFYTDVQDFYDKGYISSMSGSYQELDNFKEEWAQLGWYQWWLFEDIVLKNFVLSGHFKWSSASDTPEVSGCGIIFAINGNSHHYGMFLDKSRIQFTRADENYWYEVGKTRGTGRVDFGNPAEADVSLAVDDYKANVIVNGNFIGQYSLSKDRPLEGNLGYSLLSGTNKDYGTRCEMTNVRLWVIEP